MALSYQDILDSIDGVAYLVGDDGRIVACGRDRWGRFARVNGASNIADHRSVIGRDLFDFIVGEEVKDAYRWHLDTLRELRAREVVFPFRCDSPAMRRDMRMAISRVYDGSAFCGFLFSSVVLGTYERPPINLYDFVALNAMALGNENAASVRVCSFCLRVHWRRKGSASDAGDANSWMDPEAYYRQGGPSAPRIVHGVCPDCAGRQRGRLVG